MDLGQRSRIQFTKIKGHHLDVPCADLSKIFKTDSSGIFEVVDNHLEKLIKSSTNNLRLFVQDDKKASELKSLLAQFKQKKQQKVNCTQDDLIKIFFMFMDSLGGEATSLYQKLNHIFSKQINAAYNQKHQKPSTKLLMSIRIMLGAIQKNKSSKQILFTKALMAKLLSLIPIFQKQFKIKIFNIASLSLYIITDNQIISSQFQEYLKYLLDVVHQHRFKQVSISQILLKIGKCKLQSISKRILRNIRALIVEDLVIQQQLFSLICTIMELQNQFSLINAQLDIKTYILQRYQHKINNFFPQKQHMVDIIVQQFSKAFPKYQSCTKIIQASKGILFKKKNNNKFFYYDCRAQQSYFQYSYHGQCSFLNYSIPSTCAQFIDICLKKLFTSSPSDKTKCIALIHKLLYQYNLLIPYTIKKQIQGSNLIDYLILLPPSHQKYSLLLFLTLNNNIMIRPSAQYQYHYYKINQYIIARIIKTLMYNQDIPIQWRGFTALFLSQSRIFSHYCTAYSQSGLNLIMFFEEECQNLKAPKILPISQFLYAQHKYILINNLKNKYKINVSPNQNLIQRQFLNISSFFKTSTEKSFINNFQQMPFQEGMMQQEQFNDEQDEEQAQLMNIQHHIRGRMFHRLQQLHNRNHIRLLRSQHTQQQILIPLHPKLIDKKNKTNQMTMDNSHVFCIEDIIGFFQQQMTLQVRQTIQTDIIPAILPIKEFPCNPLVFIINKIKQPNVKIDFSYSKLSEFQSRLNKVITYLNADAVCVNKVKKQKNNSQPNFQLNFMRNLIGAQGLHRSQLVHHMQRIMQINANRSNREQQRNQPVVNINQIFNRISEQGPPILPPQSNMDIQIEKPVPIIEQRQENQRRQNNQIQQEIQEENQIINRPFQLLELPPSNSDEQHQIVQGSQNQQNPQPIQPIQILYNQLIRGQPVYQPAQHLQYLIRQNLINQPSQQLSNQPSSSQIIQQSQPSVQPSVSPSIQQNSSQIIQPRQSRQQQIIQPQIQQQVIQPPRRQQIIPPQNQLNQPSRQQQVFQQPPISNQMVSQPPINQRQILTLLGLPQNFLARARIDQQLFDSLPEQLQMQQLQNILSRNPQLLRPQNTTNVNNNPNNPLNPQEQMFNQNAAFIQSLDPMTRNQILSQAAPQFLLSLPPALRQQAQRIRIVQINRIAQQQQQRQQQRLQMQRRNIQKKIKQEPPKVQPSQFQQISEKGARILISTIFAGYKAGLVAPRVLLQNKKSLVKALSTLIGLLRCTKQNQVQQLEQIRKPYKFCEGIQINFISSLQTRILHLIFQVVNAPLYADHSLFVPFKPQSYFKFSQSILPIDIEIKPLQQLLQYSLDYYPPLASLLIKHMTQLSQKLALKLVDGIKTNKWSGQFYNNLQKLSKDQNIKKYFFQQFSQNPPKIHILAHLVRYEFARVEKIKELHQQALSSFKQENIQFLNQVYHIYTQQSLKQIQQYLVKFKKTNTQVIKALLKKGKNIYQEPINIIFKKPNCLEFQIKKYLFKTHPKIRTNSGRRLHIQVDRSCLFQSSYKQLMNRTVREIIGRTQVSFKNQPGYDAGGLRREWFLLVSRQIFNQNYGLFQKSSSGSTYQPNPRSYINLQHLNYFKFIGRFIGKALIQNQLIDAFFTRAFYKAILGQQLQFKDLQAQDYSFYKSMEWLKNNPIDPDTYTFSYIRDHFGTTQTKELIPGGINIIVNQQNKAQFIQKYCLSKMRDDFSSQIDKFLQGFYQIIPKQCIASFEAKQLQLLMSGVPQIDIEDFKKNVDYSGYNPSDPVIIWFWEIIQKYSQQQLAKLIQFITGTSKIPVEGFSHLIGMNGVQRISIHRDHCDNDLPKSHTCFNQLDLPNYISKEIMEKKLGICLAWGSQGFGFM